MFTEYSHLLAAYSAGSHPYSRWQRAWLPKLCRLKPSWVSMYRSNRDPCAYAALWCFHCGGSGRTQGCNRHMKEQQCLYSHCHLLSKNVSLF